MKAVSYSYVKYSPRVRLLLSTVEKIEHENLNFVLLLSSFFFLFLLSFYSLTHNSKRIRRIQTNHTPEDCTTLKDLPFFG